MSFLLYTRDIIDGQLHLNEKEEASLAGRHNGIIAKLLPRVLSITANAEGAWMLPVSDLLKQDDEAFIIDIKPNSKEVMLCELDRVFGYSYGEWSPIMLRLKVLYEGADRPGFNMDDFIYPDSTTTLYTMSYLRGTIENGKPIGTWNFTTGTVTPLLLYPAATSFFYSQIKEYDPNFLTETIEMLSMKDIQMDSLIT